MTTPFPSFEHLPMRCGAGLQVPNFAGPVSSCREQHRVGHFNAQNRIAVSINNVSAQERRTDFHLERPQKLIEKLSAAGLQAYPSVEVPDRATWRRIRRARTQPREHVTVFARDSASVHRRRWWHLRFLSDARRLC